ncbi:hypothetical protein GBAR_LOCUS16928 [Geodia barretti]|uniref:Uncharacterized protein n=1 Tax=Geodia barretti TaxID=519541 RepID=A0AA35SJM3_GEOBA|nr:hypothetical protein GBAR_LOCUS16928 [Geodia barretti]
MNTISVSRLFYCIGLHHCHKSYRGVWLLSLTAPRPCSLVRIDYLSVCDRDGTAR